MEFLGNLGIDLKLLIAQMVNFGLLLWLLTRFLYRPIIDRIEKDEAELKEAQTLREKLERERKEFEERKIRERIELEKRVEKIIKEAKNIALDIEKETREKAEASAAETIRQTKDKLGSLKPEIEEKIMKEARAKIKDSFREAFLAALPPHLQKKLQDVFWEDLLTHVKSLAARIAKRPDLAEILKRPKLSKTPLPKMEFEKMLAQKIGPVILEYARPLAKEQEKELEEIISSNIGAKFNIAEKLNRELINGFRFEIAGMLVESNLLSIIGEAANLSRRESHKKEWGASS